MTPGAGFADHTAAARRSTDRRAVRWVACLALSSTALTTGGHAARAQGVSAPSAPGSAAPTLTRLTITLAGVSHHEWLAPRDATRVVLPVRLDDVDDMLRSITGVGGTQLLSVSLPGPQDAINAFDALPFQADTLNDPVALLNALRGIEVSVSVKSGTVITGYLVSAEQRVEPSANPQMPVSRTRVTLKTLTGIEQFVLEDAGSLRFEDERLNMRMLSALEAIKRTSNSAIRDATISLVPGPDGVARFATVTRAPLWKTAYRLRLPQGPDGMARLTGWAVIENTETMGWTDVDVTLRSGNPVTFRQPIYQRADVDRPEAPIDAQPHPLPRIDQRGVPVAKAAPGLSPPLPAPMAPGFARMLAAPAPTLQGARDATTRQGALDATMGANAEAPEAPGDAAPDQPPLPDGVGESFHLRRPVTLAAGQSAALPFLEATVPFERIDMLPFRWPNPLRAVRITNTTRASWPGGGVSTQDEAGFSGDARLPPLPPGEARYLTYASDLSLTAHWDQASPRRRLVGYKVAEGVATLVLKQRTTTIVDLAGAAVPPPGDAGAPPASATTVIVEVPREAGTTISVRGAVAADPTAAAWRARLAVAPGATAQVRIDVDRPLLQSVQVLDAATVLAGLLGEDLDGLAPPTLAALRQIADLQARRLQSQQEVANLLRDRSEAVADQQRARQNLQILTSNDPQRQRYVDLLGAAETRIEALTGRVERGREADRQLTAQLATAIAAFSIE